MNPADTPFWRADGILDVPVEARAPNRAMAYGCPGCVHVAKRLVALMHEGSMSK
jgi:hypothetical protein